MLRACLSRMIAHMYSQESEERFQAALNHVHAQLADLRADTDAERKRLRADNARLQSAKIAAEDQLDVEIAAMRSEVDQAVDAANSEVEQAKQDAIAASSEAATLRQDLQHAKNEIKQLENRISTLKQSIEADARRHSQEMAHRAPQSQFADREAEIDRLRAVQRDAEERTSRLLAQLKNKDAALEAAETRIADMMAERGTIMAEVEDFERDLRIQTSNARRLAEELQEIQQHQNAQDADRAKSNDLERKYRDTMAQLEVMRAKVRSADEARAELDRLQKEYRAVKQDLRSTERDLRRAREESEALETWKSTHVCER